MKTLIRLLLLLSCLPSFGAGLERIALTVTVTNVPVTSNTFTVNATTRTWTNLDSTSYILTNLAGIGPATTNLANNLASFPLSGPMTFEWLGTNSFRLRAPIGGALAASSAGDWATLTLSTQSGPQTLAALWPMENLPGALSNRTNQASSFVYGLGIYSTNAFPTNSTATSNSLTKGASPQQYVSSPVQFNGVLRGAASVALTNGYTKTVTNIDSYHSNLVNYGNAIRSEGSGGNSLQVGSNAVASGPISMAIGNNSIASSNSALAVGISAIATNEQGTALGNNARTIGDAATAVGSFASASTNSFAGGFNAFAELGGVAVGQDSSAAGGLRPIAIGNNAQAGASSATAIGNFASAAHATSTAIGASATTTTTNQIRLGTASETVSIPGVLEVSGTQTNTVFSGTNKFDLAVSHSVSNITTLANGVNLVDPGFKTYIVVSGPTAAYSLDKLTRGYDGRVIEFEKQDSYTMTINDESGSAGGAATDRIRTGTGGAVTLTNNPGSFAVRYNASLGRWVLKWKTN